MSVDITGKYQMHSSQNFDEFLKAVGVSLLKRKLANAMEVATVDITRSGSTFTIKTITPLKTHEVTFVLGMTMHETTIDGREVQSHFTLEGNVLKQKQKDANGLESFTDREFKPHELIVTMQCKNVVAIRRYTKVI